MPVTKPVVQLLQVVERCAGGGQYVAPVVGDAFELIPGCRKREADCRDKYGNIINFFGFTRIPTSSTYIKTGAT